MTGAGSDGRRNTSLIDWAHNTFNEEPLFWLSSIRSKQGCVFFKPTFANEFSLSESGKYAATWCCIDLLNPPDLPGTTQVLGKIRNQSLQLGVFGFGLLQDRNVAVGVDDAVVGDSLADEPI
jgi:hypothetical protein